MFDSDEKNISTLFHCTALSSTLCLPLAPCMNYPTAIIPGPPSTLTRASAKSYDTTSHTNGACFCFHARHDNTRSISEPIHDFLPRATELHLHYIECPFSFLRNESSRTSTHLDHASREQMVARTTIPYSTNCTIRRRHSHPHDNMERQWRCRPGSQFAGSSVNTERPLPA
jgi:hypothetical protein